MAALLYQRQPRLAQGNRCLHLMQTGTTALSTLTRLETLRLYELENLDEAAFCAAAAALTR